MNLGNDDFVKALWDQCHSTQFVNCSNNRNENRRIKSLEYFTISTRQGIIFNLYQKLRHFSHTILAQKVIEIQTLSHKRYLRIVHYSSLSIGFHFHNFKENFRH